MRAYMESEKRFSPRLMHSLLTSRQNGAVLIISLLFLWLISLLVIESTEINRVYFQLASNSKLSKQSEAFADQTCHHAHLVLEKLFSGEGRDYPSNITLNLSLEDLYVSKVNESDREDSSKWPLLLSFKKGAMYGVARYSLTSIRYSSLENRHRHYSNNSASASLRELLEMSFELRCEGAVLDEPNNNPVWIYRDYKVMKLRGV